MRFNRDGWGSLALPRMNAHRMVVIAAVLTILVTAMLAGALAVLGGRALPIAVHHDLSAGGNTTVVISGSVSASDDAQYGAILPGRLRNALDGAPFTLYHAAWSDPLGFTGGNGPPARGNVPIAEAAALGDVTAHAVLVSGRWPDTAPSGGVIPAALPAPAAALLHVTTSDVLQFKDRVNGAAVRFRITGLYRPAQAAGHAAQYWQLDLVSRSGSSTASGFTTYGPLTVLPSAFTGTGSGSASGASGLTEDQASWLAEPRTALLSAIAANLDVARSLLAICAILLALLAGAVVLAVARLLFGQREGETAMLAARGATRGQLLR